VSSLIERVVEAAMELVGARGGTVGLLEHDRIWFRRIRLDQSWIDIDMAAGRGQGVAGLVWNRMKPYVTNHWPLDPLVESRLQKHFGFQRVVAVPMVNRSDTLVGILEVHDSVSGRDFAQIDAEMLQLLAHQATIAMDNARLNQLKDEFLSVVSHELKTPVTSIKGFVQLLQRRLALESEERYAHYLDVLNHQTDRLTGLIDNLLDLARTRRGALSFQKALLEYVEFVRDAVARAQLIAPRNVLSVRTPDRAMVVGNLDRLDQVIVNLIDNAVKYGPAGGPIHVTVDIHDDNVVTRVWDTGRGFPPGEEEQVFDPFYQIHQSSSQYSRGLGLGLYLSRQIVEEHGGRIWIEGSEGTCVCFTLPAAEGLSSTTIEAR
jgi:signal transduction histidine kinase